MRKSELLLMLASPILLIGCTAREADSTDVSRIHSLYGYEENEIAFERGFGVFVIVDADGLRWKNKRYRLRELYAVVSDEMRRNNLRPDEVSRAPFSVKVVDPVSYGTVFSVLELAESLGFRVKSVVYCNDRLFCHDVGKSKLSLPVFRFGNGLLARDDRLKNGYAIELYSDGVLLSDGNEVSIDEDGCLIATIASGVAEKLRYAVGEVIIRADMDVDYSFVDFALQSACKGGANCVFLEGVNADGGRRGYVVVGIPVPDDFYWAWEVDE